MGRCLQPECGGDAGTAFALLLDTTREQAKEFKARRACVLLDDRDRMIRADVDPKEYADCAEYAAVEEPAMRVWEDLGTVSAVNAETVLDRYKRATLKALA